MNRLRAPWVVLVVLALALGSTSCQKKAAKTAPEVPTVQAETTPPPPPPKTEAPPPAAEPPGTRTVKVPVAVGTKVHATRYLGPWATVVKGDGFKIRYRGKDDWVEIVEAEGISVAADCAGGTVLGNAWIPRSAVTLPE